MVNKNFAGITANAARLRIDSDVRSHDKNFAVITANKTKPEVAANGP